MFSVSRVYKDSFETINPFGEVTIYSQRNQTAEAESKKWNRLHLTVPNLYVHGTGITYRVQFELSQELPSQCQYHK